MSDSQNSALFFPDSERAAVEHKLKIWLLKYLEENRLVSEDDLADAFREIVQQLPVLFANSSKRRFPSSHDSWTAILQSEALADHLRQYFKVPLEQANKLRRYPASIQEEHRRAEIRRGARDEDGHRANCPRDLRYTTDWLTAHRFETSGIRNQCDCDFFDSLQWQIVVEQEEDLWKSRSRF